MIFAREGKYEVKHKLFHSSLTLKENIEIADALNRKAVQTCKDSGLPYFFIDQSFQSGSNFGNRLHNAFEEVFLHGFNNVIAIGNDCPDLCVKDLLRAQESVENGETVLGPSLDGGVYLLGINRNRHLSGYLKAIDWNTSKVYGQLLGAVMERVHSLAIRYDIDRVLTKRLSKQSAAIKKLWNQITAWLAHPQVEVSAVRVSLRYNAISLQRGPPVI